MGAGEGVFVWEVVREGEERGDKWCRIGVIVVRVEQDMAREREKRIINTLNGQKGREIEKLKRRISNMNHEK